MNPQIPPNDAPYNNARGGIIGYWLAWVALLAALFCVLAAYGPGRAFYAVTHNSDAMFIPTFWRDVLARGSFMGWDLPTNPYLFPDMALFIPLLALVRNVHLATLLYGLLQLTLIAVGLVWLQSELFAKSRFAQTLSLLTLTVCIMLIATGQEIFYPFMLMSVHHTSVLLVIPFAAVLMIRALSPAEPTNQAIWLLFAITLLMSLSDSLFIVQFVLPAMLALLLWARRTKISWRRLLLLEGGLLLAAALGQTLRQFIVPVDKLLRYTTTENAEAISDALSGFATWLNQLVARDPLFVLFWLFSVVTLVVTLSIGIRSRRQQTQLPALVATLVLLASMIGVVVTLVSGNFQDAISTRYFLPTLYLPLFTGLPLLLATSLPLAWVPKGRRVATIASLLAIVSIVTLLVTGTPITLASITLASITRSQDAFLACLMQGAAQRHIQNGLAGYWQADSTSAISEGALNIVPVDDNLSPVDWNNNRARYQAPFEFVIIDENASAPWLIRKAFVLQRFGQPADSFECANSEILVYNRPTDTPIRKWFANRPEFAELTQVGDDAHFYGYALPSANGGVSIGLSQGASDDWGNSDGTLVYATLRDLPAGSYALAFDLYADSMNTGLWEVIDKRPENDLLLKTGVITAAGASVMSGYFTLLQAANVEIRVKYNGHGTLFVDQMRIAHVEATQAASFTFADSPASVAPSQPALSLIHPYTQSVIATRNVDFVWQWTGQPLPKQQTFEVRLWRKGERTHYGAHDAKATASLVRQVGDTYSLRLDLNGAYSVTQHGDGDYEWTVGIVAIEPAYQDLQIEATPYPLSYQPEAP